MHFLKNTYKLSLLLKTLTSGIIDLKKLDSIQPKRQPTDSRFVDVRIIGDYIIICKKYFFPFAKYKQIHCSYFQPLLPLPPPETIFNTIYQLSFTSNQIFISLRFWIFKTILYVIQRVLHIFVRILTFCMTFSFKIKTCLESDWNRIS